MVESTEAFGKKTRSMDTEFKQMQMEVKSVQPSLTTKFSDLAYTLQRQMQRNMGSGNRVRK